MKLQLLCGVAFGACLIGAGGAHAQTAPVQEDTLDEIIVTAQKREEKVSDVPISITVVNAEVLTNTSSNNLIQLQGVVPGITFQGDKSYGGASIAIRGVTGNSSPLQDDPVPVYIDGVYQASNNMTGGSVADVSSVEIVRGPQGTLQGRNATAGALLVRTRDPGEVLNGELNASLASPFEWRLGGAIGGPLSDTLGVRLSADHYYDRGWLKNVTTDNWLGGQTADNLRAVLLWRPTEEFSGRLMVNYQRNESRQALARWATSALNPTGQAVTVPTPHVSLTQAEQDRILEDHEIAQVRDSQSTTESPSMALELTYDIGSMSLISISGANISDIQGTTASGDVGLPDRYGYNIGRVYTANYSQELRLQSNGDGAFSWLIGGYVSQGIGHFRFDIYNLRLTVPTDRVSMYTARQRNPTSAVFADATYDLSDQFSITAGVRYTRETKEFSNTFVVRNVPSTTIITGPLLFNPADVTWDDTSYRLKGIYRPNENTMIYASYSRGFKSGGFNAFTAGTSVAYNPEILTSAEVGIKADFFDRRVYVAASYYDNAYDNLQVTTGVPTGGVMITNAASASISGFEVEGQWRLTDRLTIDANTAYIDGVYENFQNAPNIRGVLVDASGKRVRATPEWQYFVQASYEFPVSADWYGDVRVNWRWRDQIFLNATDQNFPNLIGEELGELGFRVAFTNDTSGLTASIYGTNLTDDRGVTSQGLAFAYPSSAFNRPRSVGIQLQKTF